jgi:hypothetical protein
MFCLLSVWSLDSICGIWSGSIHTTCLYQLTIQSAQNKRKLLVPQVGWLFIQPYSSYLLLALVSQYWERYAQSCVHNCYQNTHPHSVAWIQLFKQHKKPKSKMRRKLTRCYRKCSKWLLAALKHALCLWRNPCETCWSSSAKIEVTTFLLLFWRTSVVRGVFLYNFPFRFPTNKSQTLRFGYFWDHNPVLLALSLNTSCSAIIEFHSVCTVALSC